MKSGLFLFGGSPQHWCLSVAYLIIVTTATTGGGVPFSSRRTFSTENAKWTVFRKVYSENKNTEYSKENTKYAKKNTKYAKQNTKYAKQNTKYAKQNTKYAISIKIVRKKMP